MNKLAKVLLSCIFFVFLSVAPAVSGSIPSNELIGKVAGYKIAGKFKDSSGIYHVFYYKGNKLNYRQLFLYELDTGIWVIQRQGIWVKIVK